MQVPDSTQVPDLPCQPAFRLAAGGYGGRAEGRRLSLPRGDIRRTARHPR